MKLRRTTVALAKVVRPGFLEKDAA